MEQQAEENSCKRFMRFHWNGVFLLISFLLLFPVAFIPPIRQNGAFFVFALMILWYVVDILPPAAVAMLPIMFFPPLGILSSDETCMNYCKNTQVVFLAGCFVGIIFEISKTSEPMAFRWVKTFSHRPRILLISLMVPSWLLSAFLPNAVVCGLMVPLTKSIIQVLETISVGKLVDETRELKDDEQPYPTNLTNGLALGVAFATTIGGMVTLSGSDVGSTMYQDYQRIIPNAHGKITYGNYLLLSLPLSFFLLLFTIFYLEILFFGLFRKNSPDNLAFDNEASRNALSTAIAELPRYTIYNGLVLAFYVLLCILCIFLKPLFMKGIADAVSEKIVKHSAVCVIICFIFFILPSKYGFLNYFICKKPPEYKTSPSMLGWAPIQKYMLWNYFFVYGSSMVVAESMRRINLPIFVSYYSQNNNLLLDRIYYLLMATFFTVLAIDELVAKHLNIGAARQYILLSRHPGNVFHSITFGSQLSFLLPVSSVTNCFVSGWFNIRARYVMMAGAGPLIVGFLLNLIFVTGLVPAVHPEFSSKPY